MAESNGVRRMKLGSQGLEVSAQGLGCMGMSAFYGPPKPEEDMIKLIHHAINSGITFLDTSDIYGPHTNEVLLGKALKEGWREKVELASKFGIRYVDGKGEIRGDPAYVRAACEGSLKRLDIDCIDLYYQHRIDTNTPIEVTMGELKKLVEEGKIKYIGLSEASASTIRRAHAVHPITAVQIEWSLWTRDVEEDIVPTCRELGIGIVAYSPLGRGFLSSGPKMTENFAKEDYRQHLPRFKPENLEHNKHLFERVSEIAAQKGCTPGQLALAWVHHQGDDVCPIPGTTKIENLNQNIGALSVKLTPEEMAELESLASANIEEKLVLKRRFSDTLDLNLGCDESNGNKTAKNGDYDQMEQSSAPKPPPSKTQLVGWPPVRASRKNVMKSYKYVKVAVDGAPYLRKVDLELYNSYQELLKALEDMFSSFTIRNFFNEGKLMDPVNGSDYVPTYEDKDGDWMMVGDVPWNMFVESCKRIRLMNSSEAVGLGPRTPFKID